MGVNKHSEDAEVFTVLGVCSRKVEVSPGKFQYVTLERGSGLGDQIIARRGQLFRAALVIRVIAMDDGTERRLRYPVSLLYCSKEKRAQVSTERGMSLPKESWVKMARAAVESYYC